MVFDVLKNMNNDAYCVYANGYHVIKTGLTKYQAEVLAKELDGVLAKNILNLQRYEVKSTTLIINDFKYYVLDNLMDDAVGRFKTKVDADNFAAIKNKEDH